jgi:glutathione synthase/RimK-type ligase-like ATP-grasp enzyme
LNILAVSDNHQGIGGSRGVGVIKLESLHSLFSTVDYLVSQGTGFILRRYIPSREVGRLIVVGTTVVAAVAYLSPDDDFRTSIAEQPVAVKREYPLDIQKLAVDATQLLGTDFGGVDIVTGPDGSSYVLEVNSPCSFQRTQRVSGVNVAGRMLDHLIAKSTDNLQTPFGVTAPFGK